VVQAAEVADDRGERGCDDRLIQRRKQHHQHQPAEDDEDIALCGGRGPRL
jgi:hypothetical protein